MPKTIKTPKKTTSKAKPGAAVSFAVSSLNSTSNSASLVAPVIYQFQVGGPLSRGVGPSSAIPAKLGDRQKWTKDILSIRKFTQPDWEWDVTQAVLDEAVANFKLASSRGVKTPVILAGAGSDPHDEHAGAKIGEVTDLRSENGVLIADLWTSHSTDQTVYQLDTLGHEVSPEIRAGWQDGGGHVYGWHLMHVAVVTHPVMAGQGPFIRQMSTFTQSSNSKSPSKFTSKGSPSMAKAKQFINRLATESDTEEEGVADESFSIDEVKQFLADAGYPIPEIATTKVAVMAAFQAMVGGGEETTEELAPVDATATSPEQMASLSTNPNATPRQLRTTMKAGSIGWAADIKSAKALTVQMSSLNASIEADKKTAFETELEKHVTRGALTAEESKALIDSIGKPTGYKLSTLSYLSKVPGTAEAEANKSKPAKASAPASTVRSMATAKPTGVSDSRPTDEQCRAAAFSAMGRAAPKAPAAA